VLAHRPKWPAPVPLLAGQVRHRELRAAPTHFDGDSGWRRPAATAPLSRMDGPGRGGDFRLPEPVPREVLAKVIGHDCNLDRIIDAIRDELRDLTTWGGRRRPATSHQDAVCGYDLRDRARRRRAQTAVSAGCSAGRSAAI